MEFHDKMFALSFLQNLMNDPLNISVIRSVLTGILRGTRDTFRLTDHEILDQLAEEVSRGYIRLVLREGSKLYLDGGGGSWQGETQTEEGGPAETSSAVETQTEEAPAPRPTREAEPRLVTPPVETRQQPISQPPVEEADVVPEGAAEAQAATMVQAAESGVPFCDT